MWNNIRNPPFISQGQNGPEFIAGGFSNQFGIETYLVAAIYGLVSFGIVMLAHAKNVDGSNQKGFDFFNIKSLL